MLVSPSKSLIEVVELARFVPKLAPKKMLSDFDKSESREARLYRFIVQSQHGLSDFEIQKTTGLDERSYQKALSSLKLKLLEIVEHFELPPEQFSEYARRLLALDHAHTRTRILSRLGCAYTEESEARQWLEEAIILEEWHTALSFLSMLLGSISISGNKKEQARLEKEYERISLLENACIQAERAQEHTVIVFAKSGAEHPELQGMLEGVIRELEPIAKQHKTFRLSEALLTLRKQSLQVNEDYGVALGIANEMQALLHSFPLFSNRARQGRNALTRFLCLVQLERYKEAQAEVKSSESLFDSESQNWFTYEEWRFLLAMHTGDYERAYRRVTDIMSRSQFSAQTEALQNRWGLFRWYSELYTERLAPFQKTSKKQRTGEIVRSALRIFPTFKGDYLGYQMAVVIFEILYALENHSELYVLSRIEALEKYKARHPGKSESQTDVFIELLQLLKKYDFDTRKILPKAKVLLDRMASIKTFDKLRGQQILPYRILWERVASLLK